MKKKILLTFQIIVLLSFSSASSHAGDLVNKLSLGFGYPYFGMKYSLSKEFSAEARGAFSDGIQIYGARAYYNFSPIEKLTPVTGLELDYVIFDSDNIEGSGIIGYPFAGGEYRVIDKLSLIIDFGPAFISLKEDEFELTVGGFEWVVNLGVYYYFR